MFSLYLTKDIYLTMAVKYAIFLKYKSRYLSAHGTSGHGPSSVKTAYRRGREAFLSRFEAEERCKQWASLIEEVVSR